MQRAELAAGRGQSPLDETDLKDMVVGVGVASDKAEVSKAAARIGTQPSPATLDHTYGNVPEPVIYLEFL